MRTLRSQIRESFQSSNQRLCRMAQVSLIYIYAQEPTGGQKATPPFVEGSVDERWPSVVFARAT
jgi:hypothetical protein